MLLVARTILDLRAAIWLGELAGISALTSCGGFPLAFSNDELTSHGLLPSLGRARDPEPRTANVWRVLDSRSPAETVEGLDRPEVWAECVVIDVNGQRASLTEVGREDRCVTFGSDGTSRR